MFLSHLRSGLAPRSPAKRDEVGFTLIEVLVVMVVMSFLISSALIVLSKSRRQARDSARVSNVAQLQNALASYHRDQQVYPSIITLGVPLVFGATTYMNKVPNYPLPVDAPCANGSTYQYVSNSPYTSYSISFCISSQVSDLPAGTRVAVPEGIK